VPEPKSLKMDKVWYKRFTAVCSNGKPVTGSMII